MFIVDKDRTNLVNTDNVLFIARYEDSDEDTIEYVAYTNNHTIQLGIYEDTPEHENMLDKIVQCAGAINVFYMPEE